MPCRLCCRPGRSKPIIKLPKEARGFSFACRAASLSAGSLYHPPLAKGRELRLRGYVLRGFSLGDALLVFRRPRSRKESCVLFHIACPECGSRIVKTGTAT